MKPLYCLLLLASILPCGMSAAEPDIVIAPPLAVPRMSGGDLRDPEPRPAPIGWVDTIGGTVYDWQLNGPAYRMAVTTPGFGVHVLWTYSEDTAGYSDRNMRYNFYDFISNEWNWQDPDYMRSGVNVFSARSGHGRLATDPATGSAVVSCHQGSIYPVVARDIAPGAGVFEYCDGRPELDMMQWPIVDVTPSRSLHLVMMDWASGAIGFYSRCQTWCNWEDPIGIAPPQPDPGFPSHNIATSRVSNKVCLTWVFDDSSGPVSPGYYRESTDDGFTWCAPTEIPMPNPFGLDTTPTFHISSLSPWYDTDDNLHFVASVIPVVNDTVYIAPAVIVHWSPATGWTEVHRADPDTILAPVGYNAVFAGRPTIAQILGQPNKLCIAWEQFDGTNVEPATGLLRADIYKSHSNDGGQWWSQALRLTDPSTASCRFPCIADPMMEFEHLFVLYELDLQAGFPIQGQGNPTFNPIVVWRMTHPGVMEASWSGPHAVSIEAMPNPAASRTRVEYALPRAYVADLGLFDAAGRCVRTLVSGRVEAGRHSVEWDAAGVPRGVYFLKLATPDKTLTSKLTVAR